MFFTSERISIVDYIASPTPTRSKFVFQQPKLSYENNLFLLSFRWTVWYSTVALVFLLFLALLLVAFWEWKKASNEIHQVPMLPVFLPTALDDMHSLYHSSNLYLLVYPLTPNDIITGRKSVFISILTIDYNYTLS